MTEEQARQIAELLNSRNKLARQYTAADILGEHDRFLFEVSDVGDVTGCVEVKKVQWYQIEVNHLSVLKSVEKTGVGSKLFRRAEERAKQLHGRVLQCTIREDNADS